MLKSFHPFVFDQSTFLFLIEAFDDPETYIQALQRTIEFEEELAEKFGGSGSTKSITSDIEDVDKRENSNQIVMDIKKKYERKLAAHQGKQDNLCDTNCFVLLHLVVPFSILQLLFLIQDTFYISDVRIKMLIKIWLYLEQGYVFDFLKWFSYDWMWIPTYRKEKELPSSIHSFSYQLSIGQSNAFLHDIRQ